MALVTPPAHGADAVGLEGAPRFVYPEPLTAEEIADMDRVLPVDGEAFLRWLDGDGPSPFPESQ